MSQWSDRMILETVRDHGMMTPAAERRALVLARMGYIDASGTWKLTPKGERYISTRRGPYPIGGIESRSEAMRRSQGNPISTGATVALIAGSVAVVGLVGYWLYSKSQAAVNTAVQNFNAPSTIPSSVTAPSNLPVLQPNPGVLDQQPPFVSGT